MSLLTIITNAADRLGLARPSTVIGSTDLQVRQLLALANQEGKELARQHPWQAIIFEKAITATATETQTGAIPTDFDRFVSETFYNRSAFRRVMGPMTATEWANYKGRAQSPVWDAFRVRGNAILLAPTPTAGHSYYYEYVSKYWCTTTGGSTATLAEWAADTNVGILDEELMTLGLIWRFLRAKGLDYGEAFRSYEALKMTLMSQDGGKRTVQMGASGTFKGPYKPTWPDGNWSL